jgi:exopolysaccharide biosynthesis polyprenyl glycosylphosphotransferase
MSNEIEALDQGQGLALSSGIATGTRLQDVCEEMVAKGIPVMTLVELAEQELQRIPPAWIGSQWLLFSQRIEGVHSTPNQQLKRYADVVASLALLTLSSPLLLLSSLAIHLQDGGPVFYRQTRTGLFGQPFQVLKLRTMVVDAENGTAQWAATNDKRITPLGQWLRRTRIDELPQLLNVIKGEMSLIGPRPERPELETELEDQIPNYRIRHWIRPGLSGWAQVNMPYSSSMEDAELKLSYDLFYLRNASPWLDVLILLKTIKTVLKAAGR